MLKEATIWLSYTPRSLLNTPETALTHFSLRPQQLCFPILCFSLPKLSSPISLSTETSALKSTQLHPGLLICHFPQTQITVSIPCPRLLPRSCSGHSPRCIMMRDCKHNSLWRTGKCLAWTTTKKVDSATVLF